jgi:hypothetical protein
MMDDRQIVKTLATLIRFVTPSVVTTNVDEILAWFCAVVPSDDASVIGSVLAGLLEIQEIEDRAGSGQEVILEFCEEQTDFLEGLRDDAPDVIGPILDVFWKVCREKGDSEQAV